MTPTTIIGIDPGKGGAVAIYSLDTRSIEIHDMPLLADAKGKSRLDMHRLMELMASETERTIAVIEQVGTRPGEGAVGAFTFGQMCGAIDMAAIANALELRRVTPPVWKKHFKLIFPKGTSGTAIKAASRGVAQERFPSYARLFARVRDDGRAEAALMALYGAEVLL